ncbi:MAG TPA: VWA domain-containing protein [Acidobacteriota bacterium]
MPAFLFLMAALRVVTPQTGEPVRGPRVIRVDAGELQIKKVDFFVDQVLIGSDDKAPFARLHDFGDGGRAHEIKVVAHLRRGAPLEREVVQPPAPEVAARARAVVVDVAVYDPDGALVEGLGPTDFSVEEDGELQEVDFFAVGRDDPRPLSVLLAVDTSESMAERMRLASKAAAAFAGSLGERGRVGLLTFDREVRLLSELQSEPEVIQGALERLEAGGDTALLRALEEGSLLLREVPGRRVLVLFSDGIDTCSRGLSFDTVRRELLEAEVTVFPIGMRRWTDSAETFLGRRQLLRLAQETGGRAQMLSSAGQIAGALEQVATDLASRYMISYRPPDACRSDYHQLSIAVQQPELKVVAKPGYFDRTRM